MSMSVSGGGGGVPLNPEQDSKGKTDTSSKPSSAQETSFTPQPKDASLIQKSQTLEGHAKKLESSIHKDYTPKGKSLPVLRAQVDFLKSQLSTIKPIPENQQKIATLEQAIKDVEKEIKEKTPLTMPELVEKLDAEQKELGDLQEDLDFYQTSDGAEETQKKVFEDAIKEKQKTVDSLKEQIESLKKKEIEAQKPPSPKTPVKSSLPTTATAASPTKKANGKQEMLKIIVEKDEGEKAPPTRISATSIESSPKTPKTPERQLTEAQETHRRLKDQLSLAKGLSEDASKTLQSRIGALEKEIAKLKEARGSPVPASPSTPLTPPTPLTRGTSRSLPARPATPPTSSGVQSAPTTAKEQPATAKEQPEPIFLEENPVLKRLHLQGELNELRADLKSSVEELASKKAEVDKLKSQNTLLPTNLSSRIRELEKWIPKVKSTIAEKEEELKKANTELAEIRAKTTSKPAKATPEPLSPGAKKLLDERRTSLQLTEQGVQLKSRESELRAADRRLQEDRKSGGDVTKLETTVKTLQGEINKLKDDLTGVLNTLQKENETVVDPYKKTTKAVKSPDEMAVNRVLIQEINQYLGIKK